MDGVLAKCPENDDCVSLFSDNDKGLRKWANEKRRRYNKTVHGKKSATSPLNQVQIDLLNGMIFIWNANEHVWSILLNELREFHKKHGHCLVPRTCNHFPKLG